jgi:hypothetical protein
MGSEQQVRSASADALVQSVDAPPRDVTTILSEWRDAERRQSTAVAGSAEETAARDDVDRLRAEYQQAHRAADGTPPQ